MMPVMDGQELYEIIKDSKALLHPFIFFDLQRTKFKRKLVA
jgi:hypothetical protein